MSTTAYKWNPYRIFTITYKVFGKKGRAVSYKNTSKEAVKDVRDSIVWSKHPTFKIMKVECKQY